ncbi:MAG: enoyl-CoA hydratase/isomerase family protein [Dehalococcoidia bacterium]
MEFKNIIYAKEEGVATITLNRPRSLNDAIPRLQDELGSAIEAAGIDPEVKVVVITGSGRAFCSGGNPRIIARAGGSPQDTIYNLRHRLHRIARAAAGLDKPYLGAINGPAVGVGMDLASMCDMRIASERARFGMLYVRMGVSPRGGGCYYLPRIVGVARACELIWTGRMMDAEEALSMGYVSRVVPPEELMATTMDLARQLARGPSVAIELTKRQIYSGLLADLNTALEAQVHAALIEITTEDGREGFQSWVEKREPVFKGR